MEYIQKIEQRLKEMGITAKKMLLELGYSDNLISHWKKGSEPSALKLMRMCEYMELSLDYLLAGQESLSKDLAPDESELVQLYRKLEPAKQIEYRAELKGYVKAKEESKAN